MGLTPTDWNERLAGLDRALVRILIGWLPQLRPLLTRTVLQTPNARAGDVDGFDGITTRGTPERLLSTEWALAEAAPDLFLMRAAAGEQLHHQLSRREDANHQDVLLIVDTSPSQAGAPQLVPLAMALVLLRAGECSVWWTDTRAPGENHVLTLDDLDSLLAMLTPGTAEVVDPLIWQACVESAEAMTTVCIGQPPDGIGDAHVHIRELLTEPVLEVRLGSERVHLPLPSPHDAARALRAERPFSPQGGLDGRNMHLQLASSSRLRIYLWNSDMVRKVEPEKSDFILTMASPSSRIVGVAERGGREWVMQRIGTGYSCGNPCLSPYSISPKWRKGIPHNVDARVHGVWRRNQGFAMQIDEQIYVMPDDDSTCSTIINARVGGVVQDNSHQILAATPMASNGGYGWVADNGLMASSRTMPGVDPTLTFAPTWNGGIRAITTKGHFAIRGPDTPYAQTTRPPPGLLAFWNLFTVGILRVVLKPKVGTLHVGTQLITAPKLIKAVAHHKLPTVIGITEANALVRIDLRTSPGASTRIKSRLTVLVSRL